MKRYNLHKVIIPLAGDGHFMNVLELKLIEDDQGEWVKYEDVKLIANTQYLAGYMKAKPDLCVTCGLEANKNKVTECNCKLESTIRINQSAIEYNPKTPYWICPVHGYKRL